MLPVQVIVQHKNPNKSYGYSYKLGAIPSGYREATPDEFEAHCDRLAKASGYALEVKTIEVPKEKKQKKTKKVITDLSDLAVEFDSIIVEQAD